MNKKQVVSLLAFGVLVGGVAYCVKKYYDEKKLLEQEGVIDLKEARSMVAARKAEEDAIHQAKIREVDEIIRQAKIRRGELPPDPEPEHKTEPLTEEELEFLRNMGEESELNELMQEAHEEVDWNSSFGVYNEKEDNESSPLTKEEFILRHEPSSIEALEQFMDMELAEWTPQDFTRRRMRELFNYVFMVNNDGDRITHEQIVDYRAEFFGPDSTWIKNITIADLILHYARLTDYNVGKGVRYWVEQILERNGLDYIDTDEEIMDAVDKINNHNYYCHPMDSYGLFGLEGYDMDRAVELASRSIYQAVTHEVQFQIFLEEVM